MKRGYDVVVAYDLAKVDVRVRFPLPAPNLQWLGLRQAIDPHKID